MISLLWETALHHFVRLFQRLPVYLLCANPAWGFVCQLSPCSYEILFLRLSAVIMGYMHLRIDAFCAPSMPHGEPQHS